MKQSGIPSQPTLAMTLIVWVDAETLGDTGWSDLEEMQADAEKEPPIMNTVGFVMADTPTHVAVTDSIGENDCGHVTKIPKPMIIFQSTLERSSTYEQYA